MFVTDPLRSLSSVKNIKGNRACLKIPGRLKDFSFDNSTTDKSENIILDSSFDLDPGLLQIFSKFSFHNCTSKEVRVRRATPIQIKF